MPGDRRSVASNKHKIGLIPLTSVKKSNGVDLSNNKRKIQMAKEAR